MIIHTTSINFENEETHNLNLNIFLYIFLQNQMYHDTGIIYVHQVNKFIKSEVVQPSFIRLQTSDNYGSSFN